MNVFVGLGRRGLSLAVICCSAALFAAEIQEVRGRSWDRLDDLKITTDDIAAPQPLDKASIEALGGRQIRLCMIGDSITWSGEGDYWRKWLVGDVPTLAFVGTHTARLGYSHAGEGGDSTRGVLRRIDDASRIPDCPYYHVLIGINDSSAAKRAEDVCSVASNTVASILKIVEGLLARPSTRKVFLASILPGAFRGPNPFRDAAGSAANVMLRARLKERFAADGENSALDPQTSSRKVVWVEYEKILRGELETWKRPEYLKDGLHPAKKGYKILADIFAPILLREAMPDARSGTGPWGVQVENLWDEANGMSRPLIPGWYVLSFAPQGVAEGASLRVRLYTQAEDPKRVFDKTYTLPVVPDRRCEVEFMTGYERYGYTERPFRLEVTGGAVKDVQIEKMRPSRKASRYGTGTFVDSSSPICAGELLTR